MTPSTKGKAKASKRTRKRARKTEESSSSDDDAVEAAVATSTQSSREPIKSLKNIANYDLQRSKARYGEKLAEAIRLGAEKDRFIAEEASLRAQEAFEARKSESTHLEIRRLALAVEVENAPAAVRSYQLNRGLPKHTTPLPRRPHSMVGIPPPIRTECRILLLCLTTITFKIPKPTHTPNPNTRFRPRRRIQTTILPNIGMLINVSLSMVCR